MLKECDKVINSSLFSVRVVRVKAASGFMQKLMGGAMDGALGVSNPLLLAALAQELASAAEDPAVADAWLNVLQSKHQLK